MKKDCVYEIRVEGHIPADWSDWYEGLTIRNEANGEAVISGPITDQAALMGILNRATAMNITLIWVRRVEGLDLLTIRAVGGVPKDGKPSGHV